MAVPPCQDSCSAATSDTQDKWGCTSAHHLPSQPGYCLTVSDGASQYEAKDKYV